MKNNIKALSVRSKKSVYGQNFIETWQQAQSKHITSHASTRCTVFLKHTFNRLLNTQHTDWHFQNSFHKQNMITALKKH